MSSVLKLRRTSGKLLRAGLSFWGVGLSLLVGVSPASAQLNQNCIVSVLNRTVQVKPDGTWVLPNIPANFGQIRARATCVENGVTRSGQSAFFTLQPNGSTDIPPIVLGAATQIPTKLTLTSPTATLTQLNQAVQLTVTGLYASGASANLTAASTGTTYIISNPAIATITGNGLVTARASGTVLIQAQHEGSQGILSLNIILARDSDGDGILDDIELREGLNPNNPTDGIEDADRDGLNNRDELTRGTMMRNADSDTDGIADGEEVAAGRDGFVTNPLLADTDGDGVPDGSEVSSGTNPTDPNSVSLKDALSSITVVPSQFVITVNSISGQAFQQLTVTGNLKTGGTINLSSKSRGTTYTSDALTVCNFGAEDGRVYGAAEGNCTITINSNGFTATSRGTVRGFTPRAISQIAIPGYANNVDVTGSFAYVAAGSSGLQVVSVSNPLTPAVVGAADTPGNANDVRIVGNFAYVADGFAGLQVFNITNRTTPVLVGSLDTPGEAMDVVVAGNRAYIADGVSGLVIVNITNPAAPALLGVVDTPGTARGVDISGSHAVIADDAPSAGLRVINVANPATASIVGNLPLDGSPKDLRADGRLIHVASYTGGYDVVDLTNPASPLQIGGLPTTFVPRDVEVAAGFAIFAEQLFPNAVPLVDIANPASPLLRTTIDFSPLGDYAGTGIATSGPFIYMTGESFVVGPDNGTTGNTRLFVGQFLPQEDRNGVLPTVSLTSPTPNQNVIRGTNLTISADAADDVAVGAVTFIVNGAEVGVDTSAPYDATYTVPGNATTLTIVARAIDLGNNVRNSAPLTVMAIPDPLTTISGRVVRTTGVAVVGAAITCLTRTATTSANGEFTISGVPTIIGDISCIATFPEAGKILRGSTPPMAPVAGGITNVGNIVVRPGGTILLLSDLASSATTSLLAALRDAGNEVTLRPPPEFTWDNTNPALTGFRCVFHMNGNTPYNAFSAPTQQALLDFVRNGGGYLSMGWSGYESRYSAPLMNDLSLHGGGNWSVTGNTTYTKVGAQAAHPILQDLPNTFAANFVFGHEDFFGGFFTYANNPAVSLLTLPGGAPAVSVRDFGSGRVVRFSMVPNWYLDNSTVSFDTNFQKLFANAASWACR